MNERENIDLIQKSLAAIKSAAKDEIARATKDGNAQLINAWADVFHSTGMLHVHLTGLLFANFPSFASEVVAYGPGR